MNFNLNSDLVPYLDEVDLGMRSNRPYISNELMKVKNSLQIGSLELESSLESFLSVLGFSEELVVDLSQRLVENGYNTPLSLSSLRRSDSYKLNLKLGHLLLLLSGTVVMMSCVDSYVDSYVDCTG